MKIVANKPCSFGGKKYYIGDEIPSDAVKDPEMQKKMGVVSIVRNEDFSGVSTDLVAQVGDVFFNVPIMKGEKSMDLPVSETQIAEAVKIMQMSQKDAVTHVRDHVGDNTVLIFLNACDSRMTVKKEAEAKAKNLVELEESAGDA